MKMALLLGGPTASGKTGLSIKLAQYFQVPIVSVDSRQLYQEMSIGTAKPDQSELSTARHYMISTRSINEPITAADYIESVKDLILNELKNEQLVIFAGGTGLYFELLENGISNIPSISNKTTDQVTNIMNEKSFEEVLIYLKEVDPLAFNEIETTNPRRVQRALEVMLETGKSITEFWKDGRRQSTLSHYRIFKYALNPNRTKLYNKIDSRCDQMLEKGLIEEVKTLISYQSNRALQTVGYKEFFSYLNNELSFEDAVLKFKQHSRNYAKRQITWFKNRSFTLVDPKVAFEVIKKDVQEKE